MARSLLQKLTLHAAIFVALGGLLVCCGPVDRVVNSDALVLLRGGNLIQNGSFEKPPFADSPGEVIAPVQGAPGSQAKPLCSGSQSLPNWVVSIVDPPQIGCFTPTGGSASTLFWVNTPPNAMGAKINAQDGTKFIELMGFPNRAALGRLEQTVPNMSPGADYVLFLSVGSTSNINTSPTAIDVVAADSKAPDTPLGALCLDDSENPIAQRASETGCRFNAEIPPSGASDWKSKTMRFTAAGPETIIRFTGSGSGAQAAFVGLDNVQLYCAGHKVRTPTTLYYFADC